MQYDHRIDNFVIQELGKTRTCSYRELKRQIEKCLRRTLSFDVYDLHFKKLVKARILRKDPARRRGSKILYSLSNAAKEKIPLKLIAHPKQSVYRKIFEKLFFYEVHYSPRKVVSSEKEFDKLLSELNTTRKKLKWWLWSGAGSETNDTVARDVYGDSGVYCSMTARTRKIHNIEMKMYWLTKTGQSRTIEDINFICRFKENNLDITFTKIERWEINKNSSKKKLRTKYVYELPGVSIEEFMTNQWLGEKYKLADVKEAFNLLQENHLIETVAVLNNQIRFRIGNNILRNFIEAIRDIHLAEYRFLGYKWQHFDAPSHEEFQRWILLMGEQVASKFFQTMEIERRKYNKMKNDCKTIREFIEKLDKDTSLINGEHWCFSWDSEFDRYKQQRKIEPPTVKAEIEEFEKYRRETLERNLELMPANFEEEGIEEVKMLFEDIIERYPFLYDVMSIVCPNVFQPANLDLQAKIIQGELSKEVSTELLARRLGAINLSNPDVPYKYMTVRDPFTGKPIKAKILQL